MSTLVVRIPAPSDSRFAAGSWDATVGAVTPIRVLDETAPGGTSARDGICTAAEVDDDGAFATLTFDVLEVPAGIVEGLFITSTVVSVTP
jgi:hypothetical protein